VRRIARHLQTSQSRETFVFVVLGVSLLVVGGVASVLFQETKAGQAGSGQKDYIWVDGSSGVDSPDCVTQVDDPSSITPCATVQYVIDFIFPGDGDEVRIRGKDDGGAQIIYSGAVNIDGVDVSGSSGNPTVFDSWVEGERPVFLGGSSIPIDNWISLTSPSPQGISGRGDHTSIWTGETGDPKTANKMVVWGGQTSILTSVFNTGGIWTPVDGTTPDGSLCISSGGCWESTTVDVTTPEPRREHIAVWTGSHRVIGGGGEPNRTPV